MHSAEYVDEKEAAKFLGLAVGTLTQWRFRGVGPKFVRLGRSVRYSLSALREYAEERVVETADTAD